MPEPGTLHHAFLEDHRRLTRGLAAVLETLRRGDLTGATRAAEVLDEAAGPHVAFQEDVLYPALGSQVGRVRVERLYEDLRSGQHALQVLIEHVDRPLTPAERAGCIAELQVALDHAITSEALVGGLDALDAEREGALFAQLLGFRRLALRWTELERARMS